ncbi:MAG: DUF4876 domain-containing protein [Bacteroidales bacterium]|nr:DUF4876 domain-containing protein [Bacteroidales bacterium]
MRIPTIITMGCLAALLLSCVKEGSVEYVRWTPVLDESSLGKDIPRPDSYHVRMTNIGTEQALEFDWSTSSPNAFRLVPGIYNVTVSAQGTTGGKACNYIGSVAGIEIFDEKSASPAIPISVSISSALVFKEIHYNASMVTGSASARYLKDTFFEVYNNSDQVVYADGICLGDPLSDKVYDFSDKLEHADQYVFIGTYVWQIPGSGKDYPINPGESFVIAASGIDHSKTATTVDLSTAEFETICDKYKEKGGQPDANALNMTLRCTIKESGLGNQLGKFTDGAWVIFYPSQPLRKDGEYLESNHANNYGQEVLKSDVLDAIDLLKTENPDDKRLPIALDAGWIKCKTTGSNQSVVRKVAETLPDGRIVLQDTNNTTDDFTVNDTPQIRRYGVKRPAWSTWNTAQ